MALRPTVLLAPLLLEHADFLGLVELADDADHLGARHERGASGHVARIIADEEDLVERDFAAGFTGVVSVDGDDGARLDTELAARGLDDCKHGQLSESGSGTEFPRHRNYKGYHRARRD